MCVSKTVHGTFCDSSPREQRRTREAQSEEPDSAAWGTREALGSTRASGRAPGNVAGAPRPRLEVRPRPRATTRSPVKRHTQRGRIFPFFKTMCESGFLGLSSPPMSSRAPTPLLLGLGQTEVKLSPGGRGDPAPHAAGARLLGCQGPPSPPAALPSRPPPPQTSPLVGRFVQVPCSPGSLAASFGSSVLPPSPGHNGLW